MPGLLAVAAQRTPAGAWEWSNEPDIFDALRARMKARAGTLDELLLDFAVARAFVGSRSDGRTSPTSRASATLGRVRFEWAVPFAVAPAPPRARAPRSSPPA